MGEAAEVVSEREAQVLVALAEHLTNAEIGQRLHISVRTVESHVSSLLRKLGMSDRRELARYGRQLVEGGAADGDAPRVPRSGAAALRGAPAALTSFVGREADLAAVGQALAEARLVSMIGPGGVGKTRLAVEAGARAAAGFPGGAWFVDLVPVRTGGVTTAVAAALGIADRPNRSLEEVIEESFRATRSLVIVDNCEHVLDAAATLLRRLLVACPGLRVLATSRELLGVTGERVVPVAPLPEEEAVTLFVERVRALDPAFDGAAVEESVAEVCARLDGIPLAIELASARCAVLGLDGLRAGFGDRLRLLTGTRAAYDDRHRSLRDVLDWSHGLLDRTEQTVLRRLSVFAGDVVTADATAVVADGTGGPAIDEDAVLDAIGRLTAKSLVVRRTRGATSVYRLLETVHEYAEERLDDSGEADAVRRRHLAWALAEVLATEELLVAGDDRWRTRFDDIADDVRVALGWAATEPSPAVGVHDLARAHAHLAYARRFLSEAQAAYEHAASLASDDAVAAADLRQAASVAFARMRGDLAYPHYLDAAARGGKADPAGAAIALADAATLGWRCPAEFPTPRSRAELLELVARARVLVPGDDPEVAAHLAVADAWLASRKPAGSDLTLAHRAVELTRATDDPPLESAALDAETAALWELGRVGDAARVAAERLALLDRLARHDPRTGGEVIDVFHMAADTALAAGRPGDALDHAALMRKDDVAGETSPHAATREAVVALALLGRFVEAIAEADAMRRDWERAGRPAAGWMTPATAAATLAHGLLGDRASTAEWIEVANEVAGGELARSTAAGFMAFALARVALHEGRLDDARAAIVDWDPSGRGSGYVGYADSLGAELAVLAGSADAAERIATARASVDENAWGLACLLRAEARLHADLDLMRAALATFDEIDARFEWGVTALLVGGATAAEGRAVLEGLGVALPR